MQCPRVLEEGVRLPRIKVIDGYELHLGVGK